MLRSATQKNHNALAMFAKVDPVAGSKIDPALKTPDPTPFTFEKFPNPTRYRAVVTFRAAFAFSRSTHSRKGL